MPKSQPAGGQGSQRSRTQEVKKHEPVPSIERRPATRRAAFPLEPAPLRLTGVTRTGFAIMFLFFGVAGGWAALAPLDSAAVAPGVIKVAGDRKLIQHLEGGIIAELNAVNGDIVKAGKVLIRLDNTQAKAQLDLLQSRIATREALAARLRAERDGSAEITFAAELLANQSAAARDAVAAQRDVFAAKHHNLKDEQEILAQRRHQTEEEITGLEKLIATEDKQIAAIEGESKDLEGLLKKGLTTRERNLLLRRQQREFEGERATNIASIARAKSAMAEIDMQILNLETKRLNEAVEELSKVEAELFDLREQERGAKDVLARTDITAPVDGIVMDLKVHTTGGVVKPGETLMTVVPLGEHTRGRGHGQTGGRRDDRTRSDRPRQLPGASPSTTCRHWTASWKPSRPTA